MEILAGTEAAETLARESEADIVLNAMVGAVGLAPSLATLQSGKSLALANKESLIVGGELVMDLVKGEPDRLVPVDSEHAALAQCLRGERKEDLKRVVITASGGPFREWSREELSKASVKEALAHPTWTMGPKITVDSATLMNKGLEVIEAHYLFGLEYRDIDVVVHPESIIHGIAEFADGSMMAQLSQPDMRLPIQLALGFPDRLPTGIQGLDLARLGRLTFEDLNREAFPSVGLAYSAGEKGSTFPAVLNAANEVAVMAFLEGKIRLTAIPEIVEATLGRPRARRRRVGGHAEPRRHLGAAAGIRGDREPAAVMNGDACPVPPHADVRRPVRDPVLPRHHRRHRHARGRPLRRGEGLQDEGRGVLRRLRAAAVVVPPRRDRVRRQGDPPRRLREDRRHEPAPAAAGRGPRQHLRGQADVAARGGGGLRPGHALRDRDPDPRVGAHVLRHARLRRRTR